METKDIIKWWGFPKATVINRNLPKTQIFPHIKNVKDKHFLTGSVQSIYMLANFKTDNTNISVYESDEELYQEIWFYYVKTKEQGDSEKIYRLLSALIPYPIVVLTDEPENFTLYTGRFEKLSTGYLKLLSVYPSPVYKGEEVESVLKKLVLSELPHQNFKVFYDGLRDELATQLAKSLYGKGVGEITSDTKDQLDELNHQIEVLRNKIKKEKQLNRKIGMQVQLKKLKDLLRELIN